MSYYIPQINLNLLTQDEILLITPLLDKDRCPLTHFPSFLPQNDFYEKRRYFFIKLMVCLYQNKNYWVPFFSENDIFTNSVKMQELTQRQILNQVAQQECHALIEKIVSTL